MEYIIDHMGQTLLTLAGGTAIIKMLIGLLNYISFWKKGERRVFIIKIPPVIKYENYSATVWRNLFGGNWCCGSIWNL